MIIFARELSMDKFLYEKEARVKGNITRKIKDTEPINSLLESDILETYLTGLTNCSSSKSGEITVLKGNCTMIHSQLENFQRKGILCDIDILADDGSILKAHSVVLAAHSPVISQSLSGRSMPMDITIPSVSAYSWKLILQFMYTHCMQITELTRQPAFIQPIYNAAVWLQLEELITLLTLNATGIVGTNFIFTPPISKNIVVLPCTHQHSFVHKTPIQEIPDDISSSQTTTQTKYRNLKCRFCKEASQTRLHLVNHILSSCNKLKHQQQMNTTLISVQESEVEEVTKGRNNADPTETYQSYNDIHRIKGNKFKSKPSTSDFTIRKKCQDKQQKKIGKCTLYKCIDEDCGSSFSKMTEYLTHLKNCLTGNLYKDPMNLLKVTGNEYMLIDDVSPMPTMMSDSFVHYPVFTVSEESFARGNRVYKQHYDCGHCSQKEVNMRRIVDHVANVHRKMKPFTCHKCQKGFCGLQEIKDHFLRFHSTSSSFKCDECEEEFKCKDTLRTHKNTEHKFIDEQGLPQRKYKCGWSWCPKSFKLLHHKKRHEMFHLRNEDRPFHCYHCNRRFVTKTVLAEHVRTHTGEKPFKCRVCKFSASKLANLKLHERTHGISHAKFMCNTCGHLFMRKGNFQEHLKKTKHEGTRLNKNSVSKSFKFVERPYKITNDKRELIKPLMMKDDIKTNRTPSNMISNKKNKVSYNKNTTKCKVMPNPGLLHLLQSSTVSNVTNISSTETLAKNTSALALPLKGNTTSLSEKCSSNTRVIRTNSSTVSCSIKSQSQNEQDSVVAMGNYMGNSDTVTSNSGPCIQQYSVGIGCSGFSAPDYSHLYKQLSSPAGVTFTASCNHSMIQPGSTAGVSFAAGGNSSGVSHGSGGFLQQLESLDSPSQLTVTSSVDQIQPEIIPKVVLQYPCQENMLLPNNNGQQLKLQSNYSHQKSFLHNSLTGHEAHGLNRASMQYNTQHFQEYQQGNVCNQMKNNSINTDLPSDNSSMQYSLKQSSHLIQQTSSFIHQQKYLNIQQSNVVNIDNMIHHDNQQQSGLHQGQNEQDISCIMGNKQGNNTQQQTFNG